MRESGNISELDPALMVVTDDEDEAILMATSTIGG
jgi:hypothetical protein